MTISVTSILPAINSSGFFQLKPPLDALIYPNEQYTCIAIRDLSDYMANNETPQTSIYAKYGILGDYVQDLADNMYIVCLQNSVGNRLQIPAKYLLTYPITNGIPYRAVMVCISLPAIPVSNDLSALTTAVSNAAIDILGVQPVVKVVETSKPILIDSIVDAETNAARNKIINGQTTDRSRYYGLLRSYNQLQQKITSLENYIKANHTPPLQ